MTWIVLYGSLGYAFGGQWELLNDFIAQFSGFILSLVMMGAGIYLVARFWRSAPGKYGEATQPG